MANLEIVSTFQKFILGVGSLPTLQYELLDVRTAKSTRDVLFISISHYVGENSLLVCFTNTLKGSQLAQLQARHLSLW